MKDFLEIAAIIVIALLAMLVITVGLVIGGAYAFDRPTCYAHWRNSGYEARWSLFGDCQISADGKTWMTDDAYVALHKHVTVQQK